MTLHSQLTHNGDLLIEVTERLNYLIGRMECLMLYQGYRRALIAVPTGEAGKTFTLGFSPSGGLFVVKPDGSTAPLLNEPRDRRYRAAEYLDALRILAI